MSDKEVLSQEEVETLLSKVDEHGIETGSDESDQKKYKVIDFTNQERVVRSQFPVLSRIYDRFTKKFSTSLYNLMSREIDIDTGELQILKFSEYMQTLKMPTAINVIRMNPLRGKGLICMDADMVFNFVENYFGGSGQMKTMIEEREFTLAEQTILQNITKILFTDLAHAWQPIMEVSYDLLNTEMNPQMVSVSAPNDIMMITPFTVKFEDAQGVIHVTLPYTMLEPLRSQLDTIGGRNDDEVDPNWIHSLREEILDASLSLNATLVETEVMLKDIMNMNPGDIIPIEMPDKVRLEIENIPVFYAKYGVSRDKCALKIINKIHH